MPFVNQTFVLPSHCSIDGSSPCPSTAQQPQEALRPKRPRFGIFVLPTLESAQLTDRLTEACIAFIKQLAVIDPLAQVAVVNYGTGAAISASGSPIAQPSPIIRAISRGRVQVGSEVGIGLSVAHTLVGGMWPAHLLLVVARREPRAAHVLRYATQIRRYAVVDCIGIGMHRSDVDEEFCRGIASRAGDGTRRYHWVGCERSALIGHFRNLAGDHVWA